MEWVELNKMRATLAEEELSAIFILKQKGIERISTY